MAPKGSSNIFTPTAYPLISGFKNGYRNREDKTMLPPGIMVEGSQNVLTNTFNRVGIRKGYTLDGQSGASVLAPILGSYDWERHTGDIRHLRSGFQTTADNGKLQYRYVATAGDKWMGNTFTEGEVYWIDLMDSLTSVRFNFADFWDFDNEVKSILLFVNGTSNIFQWSGGITTLKSTSNAMGVIQTFEQTGVVTTVAIINGGTGYVNGDLINLAGGDGTAALSVTVAGGVITGVTVSYGGAGYKTGNLTVLGGHGNGAVINVTAVNSVAGTGYTVGDVVTANAGGVNATFEVSEVDDYGIGSIALLTLLNPGSGYSVATVNFTGGTGAGGQVKILAVAQGWLEKFGVRSWAEEGFYSLTPNRAVMINGNVYTYTGGESTTFLVGISPDPTGEPVQSVVQQQTITTPNSAIDGLPRTFKNTLISSLKNQVYIASSDTNDVYVSKTNNFKDFTFTTPSRSPGEGAILTLDNIPTALSPQQTEMYVSAGQDQWYFTQFTLSGDLASEALEIQRLKTTSRQSAQSQALVTKIKNNLCFVSFEPIVNILGTQQNYLNDPQAQDLSYSIVNDMNSYNFDDGSIIYNKQFVYLAVPQENRMLIHNMTDPEHHYWEAPQVLPVGRFSIIEGEVYGHSYFTSETYKLFDGTNDLGLPINASATFSFVNYGDRAYPKRMTEYYVEGYISQNMSGNASLFLDIQYDVDGCATNVSYPIDGTDTRTVCLNPPNNSLGKNSLGKFPLGGNLKLQASTATPPKFRVVKTMASPNFYEEETTFHSYAIDVRWEVLAFGSDSFFAAEGNVSIKQ